MVESSFHNSDATNARQSALLRLLQVAATKSSALLMYTSALGAIALAGNHDLPPALAAIAGGVGVNILSSIIERVARGEDITNTEVLQAIEQAIATSNIEQRLASDEIQRGIGRLMQDHDHLAYAVSRSEYEIARLLAEQYSGYQIIAEELHTDLLQISDALDSVATREQSEEALALLHQIKSLIRQTNEPEPSPNLVLRLFNTKGRGRFHTSKLEFTQTSPRQQFPFGLALINLKQESAPAERINIAVHMSWQGNTNIERVQLRVDSQVQREGWKALRPDLINEQTALLTYDGSEQVRCPPGHPLQWNGFMLYLRGRFQGTFWLDYSVTSAEPRSRSKGRLGIIVHQAS